jgi:hypothetical protein
VGARRVVIDWRMLVGKVGARRVVIDWRMLVGKVGARRVECTADETEQ